MDTLIVVTTFLWLLALIPFAIHPTARKNPKGRAVYLIGAAVVSAIVTVLGIVWPATAALPLLGYWLVLVLLTGSSIKARVRYHKINRRRREDAIVRARFDHETKGLLKADL